MAEQVGLGIWAVLIGIVLGVVLLLPFVAVVSRRRGEVSAAALVVSFAALVYFVAIWTYTLLPLPDPSKISCTSPQLNLFDFVGQLVQAWNTGHMLTSFLFLQLVLNVLLFVPLGFFVRIMARRGIVVAGIVGLCLSAFIETTQLTGVWGLYPCAYRVFDVDDMLTNTTGALVGSLLSLGLPARFRVHQERVRDALRPRPVTRWRRILAALCDVVAVLLIGFATLIGSFVVAYVLDSSRGDDLVLPWEPRLVVLVPLLITGASVFATGGTIGHNAVQLRYAGSPQPRALARLLVFLGGIGGYLVLGFVPVIGDLLALLFALTALVLIFATPGARGLPGILSRAHLVDTRELARRSAPARPTGDAQ